MKLNFTIELPCKDHENCYNLEVDGEQQVVNYQVEGQPQLTNGTTTVNLGQITNLTHTSYSKISITEKFTRRVVKKLKVPLEKPLEEVEEYEELDDLLNKEYNELVYKHNDVVDTNENLKRVNNDLKHELSIKHPDPRDTMEYKTLLQQHQQAEELYKIQLDRLQEKLRDKEDQSGFDQQLREQKFKELNDGNTELSLKVKSLQEQIDLIEIQRQKLFQEKKDVEKALDDKYDHFEEMNKYINDLLLEKKERLVKLEDRERKIKELEFDLDSIIRHQTNMETQSGSYQNSLGENLLQKYTKKITTVNKFISKAKPQQSSQETNTQQNVQNQQFRQEPQLQGYQQNNNIQYMEQENYELKNRIRDLENIINNLPQNEQQAFVKYKKNNETTTTQHFYNKTITKQGGSGSQEEVASLKKRINELIDENEQLRNELKKRDEFIKSLPKTQQTDFKKLEQQKTNTIQNKVHTKEVVIQNDPELLIDLRNKEQTIQNYEREIYNLQTQMKEMKKFVQNLPQSYQDQYHVDYNQNQGEFKQSGNYRQNQNAYLDDMIQENERLKKENEVFKQFVNNLPPQQQTKVEQMQQEIPKQQKQSVYTNDPQLLVLLESKNQQIEQLDVEISNLRKQLQDQPAQINVSHRPKEHTNEVKTIEKVVIKTDPKVQQKLDEAYEHIRRLEDQNEDLRNMTIAKQSEVDELQELMEQLQKQQQEQLTTQQSTNTKEVKHVYLKPKDRTKEWTQAHDTTQNLVKNLRDLLVEISGDGNSDNLDIEIQQKNAQGYLMPILSYNKKGERYIKDLRALLEDSKQDKQKLEELKEQLRGAKQNMDIEEIKEIFQGTQLEVENMIDILKMAKKQPFVDFKKQKIDSDQIDHYFEGINKNFNDCQDFYKKIRLELEEKNKEIQRLKDFEKNVNSGLNKDICYEDFKTILSKNIKLNRQLEEIAQKVSEGNQYDMVKLKNPKPETADDTIDQIYDSFNISGQTCRDVIRILDDMKDDQHDLKKKLEEANSNQIDLDVTTLQGLIRKEFDNQKKIKDLLLSAENKPGSSFKVNYIESQKPQDIVDQVNKINDTNMVDLNQLKSILEEKNQTIDKLRDYEKQAKSGQQQNVSVINDLKYILKKSDKLYVVTLGAYNVLYNEDKEQKKFEVKEDDQDQYIDQISKSIKETQLLTDSIRDRLAQSQGELERLIQFEKQIIQGKNKENCREDFEGLFYKTKKNTKGLWNIMEKVRNLNSNTSTIWQSAVIQEPTSQEYLNGIHENLTKQEKYNRQLEDLVDTLQRHNNNLQKFRQDVESGKNKENCLQDFKNQFQEAQSINDKTREALQKVAEDQLKPKPSLDFYKNNSKEYLDAVLILNDDTRKMLSRIKDNVVDLQTENQKLTTFQKEVQSGKNKEGAKREFQEIMTQNNNFIGMMKEILKDQGIDDDIDTSRNRRTTEARNATALDLVDNINDQNDLLRKYIKKLKDRIQDLHDQLQAALRQNQTTGTELTEITTESKALQKKVVELESRTIKYEEELQQMNEIFDHAQENQILINRLLEVVSRGEIMEKVNYKIDTQERQLVLNTSMECLVFNKNKLETMTQLLKNYSSNDSMVMLNVLQQLENYKYSFREIYSQVLDDELPDTSGVVMSEAKDSEKILDFVYKNIKYLGQEIFTFQNEITDKVNVIIQAKNEILNEKNKLKLQVDDLQFEINKKTTLIGKLQVKLYMLVSILDFHENHMDK